MGTIVSKVRLKDGTVRDFADKYSRSEISIIEAAIGQIAPELEMTVHVVDDAADMPAPAASLEDKVYIYVGSTTQNYTQNTIYVCKETATAGTYTWSEIVASKDEVINIVNNIVEENKIQVTTMPTAASDLVGKVYQYIGTTNANYTNGYFYKCVEQEATAKYTAPDGNTYKHKVMGKSYDLTDQYAVYSNYKMCFVEDPLEYQDINGTRYYKLIVSGTSSRPNYCYDLRTDGDGRYTGTHIEIYPERVPSQQWGYDRDHFIFKNDTTTKANRYTEIYCTTSDNEDIPVAASVVAASAYFTAPDLVYVWERIDVQPTPVIPEQVQADWNQDDSTQKDYIKNKPDIENIQVEVMPAASSAEADNIYQYIGETDVNYTNGYFYKCVGKTPEATYTAPDGNKYIYKCNASTGDYQTKYLTVYSNKKICICTDDGIPSSYHYHYILGLYPTTDNEYAICSISLNSSTYVAKDGVLIYPSNKRILSASDYGYYVWNENGTVYSYPATTLYNYNVSNPNIPNFNTKEEALIYLETEELVYTWERINTQPAPAAHEDEVLRKEIGLLSDALGKNELYTNYIYNKNNNDIIEFEKEIGDGQDPSVVSGTFDPLLKTLKVTFTRRLSNGSVIILTGDDLFETKLSKNLPNGDYTFYGDNVSYQTNIYMCVCQCNESDPTDINIAEFRFNTFPYPTSFTIDDTYDYNWIEIGFSSNYDNLLDEYKIAVLQSEPIYATMSRPKVPRSNAAFTDHTYAIYDETNVPEGITINDGSFIFEDVGVAQPNDNPFLPSPPPAPTYANIKVKGWDDLVNSIDVKVRGTVDNTSINAGVTSEIATFEFYNGNESEEQDVTLEGVLNFSVAIVDHTNPVSIIFSVYDNLTQVGSYTVGIDTDGYKYINFKYTVSDNIGVGNKLYKIKMTPINCNIT